MSHREYPLVASRSQLGHEHLEFLTKTWHLARQTYRSSSILNTSGNSVICTNKYWLNSSKLNNRNQKFVFSSEKSLNQCDQTSTCCVPFGPHLVVQALSGGLHPGIFKIMSLLFSHGILQLMSTTCNTVFPSYFLFLSWYCHKFPQIFRFYPPRYTHVQVGAAGYSYLVRLVYTSTLPRWKIPLGPCWQSLFFHCTRCLVRAACKNNGQHDSV